MEIEELRAHGFRRCDWLVDGRIAYVRADTMGVRWLVVTSELDGPFNWTCRIYPSQTEWMSGVDAMETVGPFPYVNQLLSALWSSRLI